MSVTFITSSCRRKKSSRALTGSEEVLSLKLVGYRCWINQRIIELRKLVKEEQEEVEEEKEVEVAGDSE